MRTISLPLLLVSAAPLGSALEGYGVRWEKEWAQKWGQRAQYVSSVALLTLTTMGAAWSGRGVPLTISGGVTALFLTVPIIRCFRWHPQLDPVASVALKLTSTVALSITAYTTTPLFLTLATCHLLPSKAILSMIFGS